MPERGAILSEFPSGTHPGPENFPIRNRIVAGMPLGTLIVKGTQYSRSLIAARLAMEFGQEVFGVPGNVTQPVSFAPNQWIEQGAKLVRFGLLRLHQRRAHRRRQLFDHGLRAHEGAESPGDRFAEGEGKLIYEMLSAEEPKPIDDIARESGLNSSEVLATLFDLEIKGIVRQLPGKRFGKILL